MWTTYYNIFVSICIALASCPVAGACCACYIGTISCANGRHTRHLHPPPHLSVCFFVARSAEVINKAQSASKTDRERERGRRREGDTRAVTTNYGTVKVTDEAHLSGSLDRKGQRHVTGS